VSHRVEPLSDTHVLDTFSCGNPDLDTWLVQHARRATGQGARTYVLVDEHERSVAGYFSVAPHLLARQDVPPRIGRGAPARIPAILLVKLALDARLQGTGLGSDLLVAALTTIVSAARGAGGRIIVVDAIGDDAAAFYRRHDFEPSLSDPLRLIMKLSTAAHALGQQWP